MNYFINTNKWGKVFAVPSCVVENYIKLADGSALKVLLYMLYNNTENLSSEDIAYALTISLNEVDDAFCFWEQAGVLNKDNNIKPQNNINIQLEKPQELIKEQPKPIVLLKQKSTGSLTPKEIAERIEGSEEIAFLFSSAEISLKHLLTHTEQRSLIWIHDYLGLPADVILMLFEYCKVINKLNARYIETVAVSWQEKEILTHEAAEKEIQSLKQRQTLTVKVMSAFGINRKLTAKEEGYLLDWTNKNYDIDLIQYAYDKTIDAINKLSFPYINKIITGWYSKGLITREQIDNENENYNKINFQAKEHSYDLDKFDTLALNYTPKISSEKEN